MCKNSKCQEQDVLIARDRPGAVYYILFTLFQGLTFNDVIKFICEHPEIIVNLY